METALVLRKGVQPAVVGDNVSLAQPQLCAPKSTPAIRKHYSFAFTTPVAPMLEHSPSLPSAWSVGSAVTLQQSHPRQP